MPCEHKKRPQQGKPEGSTSIFVGFELVNEARVYSGGECCFELDNTEWNMEGAQGEQRPCDDV
jgi:hypothetical protein